MKNAFKIFSEKFTQAWSACMVCMVQGDLSVLTWSHAMTASKTGALAGLAFWITSIGNGEPRSIVFASWLTGVLTMCADIVAHPSHFGEQWVEAFCTGLFAACLCYLWERQK